MNKHRLLATLLALATTLAHAASVPLTSLDRATARALTAPEAHRTPTIVTLWSADCAYCKHNFRQLADLARAHRGLQVITVATEPASPELAAILDKLAPPGPRYAYGDDVPEALAHALDPAWRGELPRTLIFDGRGGRAAVSGTLDPARLRQALGLSR